MRLVFDTDVVVAAFRSDRGASRRLLLAAIGLTTNEVDTVLDAVALVIEPVRLAFLWRPCWRDPNDEMVLETAVNGRADHLVTFNLRHLAEAAREFGIHAGLA